jgi:hypothetical protein
MFGVYFQFTETDKVNDSDASNTQYLHARKLIFWFSDAVLYLFSNSEGAFNSFDSLFIKHYEMHATV